MAGGKDALTAEWSSMLLQGNGYWKACRCRILHAFTMVDGYAIVGLSEPREGKTFDGLPLKEELAKRGAVARCGLIVVELSTGKIVDWMTVTGIVTELFDVDFLKGKRNGSFVGLRGEDIRKTISLKPSDRPSGLF